MSIQRISGQNDGRSKWVVISLILFLVVYFKAVGHESTFEALPSLPTNYITALGGT